MQNSIQSDFKKLSLDEKDKSEKEKIAKNIQIIYNPLNLLHKSSKNHPQKPERVQKIVQHLKQTKYKKQLIEYQSLKEKLKIQEYFLDKLTKEQIFKLHGQSFHDFVQGMWPQGIKKTQMFINIDTYFMKDTYKAAFQAAKTGILAVQSSLLKKNETNICLIRPPGHHSGMRSQPHGFCFFNNVAIAADHYAKKTNKKVAILDWDIHHGQGTQKIFYQRKDVLYISIHRFDNSQFFPHIKQSGPSFVGSKEGMGFNINICWNLPKIENNKARQKTQTCCDNEYFYAFDRIVLPILKQFNPDAIFISCGFDCADGDPIGDTRVTQNGFKVMSNMIKNLNKDLFIFLEGGYNIQALKLSMVAVMEGLGTLQNSQSSQNYSQQCQKLQPLINQFAKQDIQKVLQIQKKYWNIQA